MVEERVDLPDATEKFSFSVFFSELKGLFKDKGFLDLMLSTMFLLLGAIAFSQLLQYLFLDYFQDTTYLPMPGWPFPSAGSSLLLL